MVCVVCSDLSVLILSILRYIKRSICQGNILYVDSLYTCLNMLIGHEVAYEIVFLNGLKE